MRYRGDTGLFRSLPDWRPSRRDRWSSIESRPSPAAGTRETLDTHFPYPRSIHKFSLDTRTCRRCSHGSASRCRAAADRRFSTARKYLTEISIGANQRISRRTLGRDLEAQVATRHCEGILKIRRNRRVKTLLNTGVGLLGFVCWGRLRASATKPTNSRMRSFSRAIFSETSLRLQKGMWFRRQLIAGGPTRLEPRLTPSANLAFYWSSVFGDLERTDDWVRRRVLYS